MLNNIDIAILTLVNELARRYQIEPYDFVATIRHDCQPNSRIGGSEDYSGREILAFESFPEDEIKLLRIGKMLHALGIPEEESQLIGDDDKIIKTLNKALQVAPKPRSCW